MNDLINKFFLSVTIALLRFADSVFDIFRILAGIQKVQVDGVEKTIFEIFLTNKEVAITFYSIFVVGIIAGGVCATVGIMRSVHKPEAPSPQKVFGRYLYAMLGTFLIFIMVGVLISAATTILGLLDEAFTSFKTDSINPSESAKKMGNRIIKSLIDNTLSQLNITKSYPKIDIHKGSVSDVVTRIIGQYKKHNLWQLELVGTWDENNPIYPLGDSAFAGVRTSFPYFLGLLISCILLVSTLVSSFKLVLRLFDVMVLYTVLPLPMAVYSIDDGQRLKVWKKQMIQTMVMAYGMVFSINVFLIFLPLINQFQVSQDTTGVGKILNSTVQLLMLAGGSFAIFKGQKMLEEILGISEGSTSITGGALKSTLAGAGNMVGKLFGKGGKNKEGGTGSGKGSTGKGTGSGKSRKERSAERKQKMESKRAERTQRRESNKNGGRAVRRAEAKANKFNERLNSQKAKLDNRDNKIKQREDDKQTRKQKKVNDRQARKDNQEKVKQINEGLAKRKEAYEKAKDEAKKNHERGDFYDFSKRKK